MLLQLVSLASLINTISHCASVQLLVGGWLNGQREPFLLRLLPTHTNNKITNIFIMSETNSVKKSGACACMTTLIVAAAKHLPALMHTVGYKQTQCNKEFSFTELS